MIGHQGKRLKIVLCEDMDGLLDGPPQSWVDAVDHIPAGKRDNVNAQFVARRNMLADGGQLRSPDYMNTEAELPSLRGSRSKNHFYAIKAGRIRAYGWYSDRHPGTFFISHFAYKRGDKLAAEDTKRVIANWRVIEESVR